MSGIEVAGLVMGALPLLAQGVKMLEGQLETLSLWRKFPTKFPQMIENIIDQAVEFDLNMKILIEPLDIDPERKAKLLRSAQSTAEWKDPELKVLLMARIGYDYLSRIIRMIRRIEEIVRELLGILPIKNGLIAIQANNRFATETLRVAVRLHKRTDMVDELGVLNGKIWEHLQKVRALAETPSFSLAVMTNGKKEVSFKTAKPFFQLQAQVAELQRLFAPQGWSCDCGFRHSCGISIHHEYNKVGRIGLAIEMLLGPLESQKRMRVVVEKSDQQDRGAELGNSSSLRHLVDLSNQLQLPEPSDLQKETQSMSRRGLTKAEIANTSSEMKQTKRGARDRQVEGTSGALGIFNAYKDKATVRFNLSHQADLNPRSPAASISKEVCCSFFNKTGALATSQRLTVDDTILHFNLLKQPQLGVGSALCTFAEFCSSVKHIDARIALGIELAYTILGIGPSAWFPRDWSETDLSVEQCGTAAAFYLHKNIRHALRKEASDSESHAQMSIFSFGLVLLQLLLGKQLEEEQLWKNHLAMEGEIPDWKPEVQTKYGREMAEVVDRCVNVHFVAPASLTAADFIHEVKTTVIQPLEAYVRDFNS